LIIFAALYARTRRWDADDGTGGAMRARGRRATALPFPALITAFGTQTIGKVIDAHIVIEQYCEQLTTRGGVLGGPSQTPHRRLVAMKQETVPASIALNEDTRRLRRR
jgi:hypothetical protein